MKYCGTGSLERIFIYPNENSDETHYIDLQLSATEPYFRVTCCCDEEWVHEFKYSKSTYETVKHIIMDALTIAEDMEDLMYGLDILFNDDDEENLN